MLYTLDDRRVETLGDWYVAPNAVVVGSVVLGHESSVWFNCVVRGDNDVIRIGERVNVQDGSVLHTDAGIPLVLERNVSIGHMVMLHGATVRENSLVGIGAVVLNNAVIGKNCLVGARSLVTEGKEFPDGSLILGAPARVARALTEAEIEGLAHIADHYVERAAQYRRSLAMQR